MPLPYSTKRRWSLSKSSRLRGRRAGGRFFRPGVDLLEDRCQPSTFTVVNTLDSGTGSLRQAILDARTSGDRIEFAIPGAGVHTISPLSQLPTLASGVTIDGYTQPGASPNTLTVGDNAVLLIELEGSQAGGGSPGLDLSAQDTVRGLVINSFFGDGIRVLGGADNVIAGNFIGTDAAGGQALGNRQGISVQQAPGIVIGGTAPAARNLISGSQEYGIYMANLVSQSRIQGNYMGTNAAGTAAVPNASSAIAFSAGPTSGPFDNTIGGSAPGAGNLISGNGFDGISMGIGGDNVVEGNLIGTQADGVSPLGNANIGVRVGGFGGDNNRVGGTAPGAGNVIAFNGSAGVAVNGARGHSILSNAIFSNGGLGIDLSGGPQNSFGVTPNDAGDADGGPNRLQNFPVLTAIAAGAGSTTVTGALDSVADEDFRIEFFASDDCDPSGFGEGQQFLDFINVHTDTGGQANFSFTATGDLRGRHISMTATRASTSDTSEFSPAYPVTSMGVTNTADTGPGSLRDAINCANNVPNIDRTGDGVADPDVITFAIPGAGVHTIQPATPLPSVTDPVVVDGYTQPGASANTLTVGDNAMLLVELDFQRTSGNGLALAGPGGSTVRGLVLNNYKFQFGSGGAGIRITSADNVVEGNFIGTNAAGSAEQQASRLGTATGVLVLSGTHNLIGASAPAARNVISGNNSSGIDLRSSADANTVQGNYVGTNAAGTAAVPNGNAVFINGADNVIGGATSTPGTGAGNVLGGNDGDGVQISGGRGGNTIQGNLIGLDATGTKALGEIQVNRFGVSISVPNNLVGGAGPGEGNVISGQPLAGVELRRGNGNRVQGNFIGTDITGTLAIGNETGVLLEEASHVLVGGTTPGARNVISGNTGVGVDLDYSFDDAIDILVQGNFIGTTSSGSGPLGNGSFGVHVNLDEDASADFVGGSAPGAGNLIAFNGADGVFVEDGTNFAILGNSIFANAELGIDLGPEGVTDNDAGDSDSGPNKRQNFPELAGAAVSAGSTIVTGTLSSTPNTTFRVEFFASASADPTGFGEGQSFLGFLTVTTDAAGTVSFTASVAEAPRGQAFLTATATDPLGNTSEFSGNVPIAGVSANQPPQVRDDSATTPANTPVTIAVLANDTDPDGDSLTITGATQGAHGSVTVNENGTLTYTPQAGFSGSETFHYTASDGHGGTGTAAVTVTVTAARGGVVAKPDTYHSLEDYVLRVPASRGVLANDSGGPLTARLVHGTRHGRVVLSADGSFRYTPQPNFNGPDFFQYIASNGAATSGVIRVRINVEPVPDPLVYDHGTFFVPGMLSELARVRVDLLGEYAAFNNEVGLVRVDDASGRIGNLRPGQAGYLEAARDSGRWQRLFASGQRAAAPVFVTLRAGEHFTLFIVQNNTLEAALAGQTRQRRPPVFFVDPAANADGIAHVMLRGQGASYQLGWEDMLGGGDFDFDDVILAIQSVR